MSKQVSQQVTTQATEKVAANVQTKSCAVVVTYRPDTTTLLKLLGQINKEADFIVIDNGSPEIDQIVDSIEVYKHCKDFIRLDDNEGLAKALNRGIDWALVHQYDFIFLFDQDSSLCDLFFSRMVAAYQVADPHSDKGIAAIGPRLINPLTMRQTPFKLFNRFLLRSDRPFANLESQFTADFLITSGSLVVLKHIKKIGAMKESYFIDNIDLEWCFRAKSLGFDLVGTDAAVLYHAIGERSLSPLVKAGIIAQHNPSRTYYSSRNRTHLRSVKYAPIGWKLRDIVRFLLKSLWLVIASSDRKSYLNNIRLGIRDAKNLT